jgi:DNA polymerase-3 subunit gamma/tau
MTLIRMLAFRPPGGANVPPPAATPVAASQPATGAAGSAAGPGAGRANAAAAMAAAAPAGGGNPASVDWSATVAALDLQGAPRQLAAQCALLGREGATWRLALDPRSASLRTRALEDKLTQALSRHVGSPVRLEIELAANPVPTPARAQEQAEAERLARARSAFESDPTVGALRERFGASVLTDSVRPARQDER